MAYSVKETYLTLQGEGAQVGRAAVFCRFAGCNLWTGHEADRPKAHCRFCDTQFVGTDGPGGGRFPTAEALAHHVLQAWAAVSQGGTRYVVFTGGEPLLQLDAALVDACHARGFEVAVETNGTVEAPPGIDWICVSPKPGPPLAQRRGQELKLVFPQSEPELTPERFEHLPFDNFFLQPMDGPQQRENIQQAIEYCRRRPRWRLSLQTHKMVGIP